MAKQSKKEFSLPRTIDVRLKNDTSAKEAIKKWIKCNETSAAVPPPLIFNITAVIRVPTVKPWTFGPPEAYPGSWMSLKKLKLLFERYIAAGKILAALSHTGGCVITEKFNNKTIQ